MKLKSLPSRRLLAGALSLLLLACQNKAQEPQKPVPAPPSNEVRLDPDSPKRGYIREAVVELEQRPLMDAVTGKIAYDETRTARVTSPIAGRVTQVIAALGIRVEKGQALAELDSPDLGQAQSDYAGAQADLNLAKHAYERVQELYAHGIAPLKDQEQAHDNLTRARSEAERAKLRLENLGVRNGRTDNRFILHAPIAGTVTERNINPGLEVRSDLPAPLFVLSDLSQLWVQMDIFEKDISLIHVGAKVMVQVPAYPGENFPATVNYIGQVVDESTRTIKVRCLVANPQNRLLPAMYAAIDIQSAPDDKAVVAPLTALFTEGESDWLFVAVNDGYYQKRPVKVGLRLKDRAVIREGLHPGERLVVGGALLLRTEEDAEQDAGGTKE
ncbi:MAG: efflux RND transporter periplasmic adaptor subunit [Methylobacter sp.]|jgi:cobalt-zinc-cadmium efflux system membrane fusion protein|nr:efflux RND transporter periplasmic adaptor subunit [Methylobacter sp.]